MSDGFKLYGKRWHMLFLYATSSLLNAVLWISFASIDDATAAFYHVTVDQVNWLAIVFQVVYFPGMLFALYTMAATTLRHTMVLGTGMGFTAGVLRALSAFIAPSNPSLGYAVCMAGQIVGALAQPIFLSTPAVMAANWFPVSERDLATTVGALFNPLGNALGQVIPPFVVVVAASSSGGDDDDIRPSEVTAGMQRLLVGQALALGLSFLWTFSCFCSHPPSPPSASAEQRLKATADAKAARRITKDGGGGDRDDDGGGGGEDPAQVVAALLAQFRELVRDKNFLLLLGAFSFGLAVFNALLTVINQWLKPYGFSADQAGLAGGVLILAGLVGAAISAVLMDTYHCYKEVLKAAFTMACASLVLICFVLSQGWSYGLLLAAFALMGLFTLPVLPGVIENAVEQTYPIPEEASSGLLFCCGNVLGIAFTVIFAKLVKYNETDDDDANDGNSGSTRAFFTPSSVFLLGTITLCVVLVMLYDGDYKRLKAEAKHKKQKHPLGGGGGTEPDALQSPLLGAEPPPHGTANRPTSPSSDIDGSSHLDLEV